MESNNEVKDREVAVSCRGASLTARKKTILNNISFEVPKGSITGLLGPNGAGKSSLLRIIAGLASADSGTVTIFGEPAGEAALGKLSLLPDRGGLPGWQTAAQWLSFAKGIYPDWDQEQCELLAEELKIASNTRISSMSRGEEARLQLLTCLSRTAPLVILDEPFTGVDMISREQIASTVVGALADGKRTFLIATHDIREMELLFDHLILIGSGEIKAARMVDQLRQQGKSVEAFYREVFS
ncbi:ATP-binding cassette domain-containing protein [Paenibacillus sp. CAU 1782]